MVILLSCEKDDTPPEQGQASSPLVIAGGGMSTEYDFFHLTPKVITPETTGEVILEVHSDLFSSVKPVLHTAWDLVIPLVDDGTHGDKAASDNIYTAMIDVRDILKANTPNALNRPLIGRIYFDQGYMSIWAEVWNDQLPQAVVRSISPDVQHTDRVVNIVTGHISPANRRVYLNTFYSHFDDVYDFIHIIYPGFYLNRHHITVKQDVQGIGKPIMDESSMYGSSGRLKGINVFPNTTYYDGASTGYQHELGHQWINFLEGTVLDPGIPHWPISDLANGMMGYSHGWGQGFGAPFDLIEQGDNSWVLKPRSDPPVYNDLELYLMGLIPANAVSPHFVFKNQNQTVSAGSTLVGPVTDVTIDDVIETTGMRIPDVNNSQKQFKIATIIVSYFPLSAKEMAFYDHYTQRAELKTETMVRTGYALYPSKPFYLSTGGKATLNTLFGIGTKLSP